MVTEYNCPEGGLDPATSAEAHLAAGHRIGVTESLCLCFSPIQLENITLHLANIFCLVGMESTRDDDTNLLGVARLGATPETPGSLL